MMRTRTATPATSEQPTLGRRAVRGAGTTTAGQLARMVLQFGSVVVLARLLSPSDYGLMAIGLAVVGIGEIVRDLGLSTAAIRTPDLTREQQNALFWINTAIGAGLTALCAASAALIAAVFGQPELRQLLTALAVVFLLNGASAQYRADLTKRLRFGSLVLIDVGAQVLGIVVAVVLALLGAGYYALAAQQLAAALLTLICLVLVARWSPGRPRRADGLRPLIRFGMGMLGAQVVGYLNSSVDTVVIGLRAGVADLGAYNRGFQLVMRPLNQLRAPSTTVAVPVLSRLDPSDPRANSYLVRGQLALGFTLVPATALATGAAGPLIDLALGDTWAAVAPIVALLSAAGALQTLSYVGNWIYVARGLSAQLFGYSLISLSVKVACVLVGSTWGVVGVAAGLVVASAISWPISVFYVSRLTPVPARALYGGAARILACAVTAGAAAFLAVRLTENWPSLAQLLVAALALAAVYVILVLVVRTIRRDVVATIRTVRQAIGR